MVDETWELEELEKELEEAEEFLSRSVARRIYASFGGVLFIEVSPEEARRIVERMRERIKEKKARLKR